MNTTQANRLLDVAYALRDTTPEERQSFNMARFCDNTCGTPGCALGFYAAREDIQGMFHIQQIAAQHSDAWDFIWEVWYNNPEHGEEIDYWDYELMRYFGLDMTEAEKLFSGNGCGNAKTPLQAAAFIEDFVRSKGFDVAEVRGDGV